jgi:hypothetical protein
MPPRGAVAAAAAVRVGRTSERRKGEVEAVLFF